MQGRAIPSRWWFWAALLFLIGAVAALVPLPYPTTLPEREAALHEALTALLSGTRVLTPRGLDTLSEREFVLRARGRIFFRNDTGVPDSIFLAEGLKPLPPGARLDVDHGDVLVLASYRDLHGDKTWHLQFSYIYGSLGAQGFEIRIYKCLTRRKVVFVPTWVA